jgi:hypothetical protein
LGEAHFRVGLLRLQPELLQFGAPCERDLDGLIQAGGRTLVRGYTGRAIGRFGTIGCDEPDSPYGIEHARGEQPFQTVGGLVDLHLGLR